MIRVVLDTNIIVSALRQPLGPPARVLVLALNDALKIGVSGPIYEEYEDVLRRPRLKISEPVIVETLSAIRRKGYWIKSPLKYASAPIPMTTSLSPARQRLALTISSLAMSRIFRSDGTRPKWLLLAVFSIWSFLKSDDSQEDREGFGRRASSICRDLSAVTWVRHLGSDLRTVHGRLG